MIDGHCESRDSVGVYKNVGKDLHLADFRLTEGFVTSSPTCLSRTARLQRQQQMKIRRTAGLIVGHVGHLKDTKATEGGKGHGSRRFSRTGLSVTARL